MGDFAAVPGQGVTCTVHGRALAVGALPWLISRGCAPPADAARRAFEDLEHEGKTVVGVARDATLLAVAAMADTLKPDAARVVRTLRAAGRRVLMVSGDNERTCAAVARACGIVELDAGDELANEFAVIVNRHLRQR